jgi:hypothetical protein
LPREHDARSGIYDSRIRGHLDAFVRRDMLDGFGN